MSPQAVLSHPTVERVGWTLIHFLWQGAVLAAACGVTLALLRKSKANLRYLAGCLTLALMVLAPCVTMFMVPVSESGFAVESDATASMPLLPRSPSSIEIAAPAEVSAPEGPHPEPAPSMETVRSDVAVRPAHRWKERAAALMEPALPYLVLGWLVGVFGLSVWHLGGWAQLQRLRRRMVQSVEPGLHSKVKELAELLGVRRAVALMESALVQVPTVLGWVKPVILLPASALTGLTREQLEAILAHELAHIRRFDYLVNMLQTAVEILGFYHPAVWWVSHKIRIERENCCDDLAIGVTGDKVRYATALTLLEEMRGRGAGLAVAAGGGSLLGRIRRLVGGASREEGRYSWLPAAITVLLILAIAVPTTIALSVRTGKETDLEPEVRFGPVVERTIAYWSRHAILDMDKNRTWGPNAQGKATDYPGVDLYADMYADRTGQYCCLGRAMQAAPVDSGAWDLTAADLFKHIQTMPMTKGGTSRLFTEKDEVPSAFLFKTYEGGMGILEIVGLTTAQEEAMGVIVGFTDTGFKIRYKMVHKGTAGATDVGAEGGWGEAVEGLRMRLSTRADSAYTKLDTAELLVELQNVSDEAIPLSRLPLRASPEVTDVTGTKLILKPLLTIGPWEGRNGDLAAGAVFQWTERFDRFRFVNPPEPAGKVKLCFVLPIRDRSVAPSAGTTPPLFHVKSNSIELDLKDVAPVPLKAENIPKQWTEFMDIVYREGYEPPGTYRAIRIEGNGHTAVVGRNFPDLPSSRIEVVLDREHLDKLAQFLRTHKVWELATLKPQGAYSLGGGTSFLLTSGRTSLACLFPRLHAGRQPALEALQQEMESLIKVAVQAWKKEQTGSGDAENRQTSNIIEGPFVVGQKMTPDIKAAEPEGDKPDYIQVQTLEFGTYQHSENDTELMGMVRLRERVLKNTRWRFRLDLIDPEGQVLVWSQAILTNRGLGSALAALSLGNAKITEMARLFRITIEQAPPEEAESVEEPFAVGCTRLAQLTAGTSKIRSLVQFTTIDFQLSQDGLLEATLHGGGIQVADTQWLLRLELLDHNGDLLANAETTYTTSKQEHYRPHSSSLQPPTKEEIHFSLGRWESLSSAARFRLSIQPMPDARVEAVEAETKAVPSSQLEFGATLPNGVTVELVGLYHGETTEDLVFWKPDGSAFSDSESQKYRERVVFPEWGSKDFRFEYGLMTRFSPLDELNTEMFVKQGQRMSYRYPRSDGIAIALVASDWNDREDGFSKVGYIKAAAAYGGWETRKWTAIINEPSVRYLDDHSNIMFSPPRKTDEWVVDVTVNAGNIDFDCFYELKDGSIHQAERRRTMGHPNWIGPDQRTPMICKRYTLAHEPEDIREYIIKYRRFEIVEFRNVSLKRGVKTDVEVLVPAKAASGDVPVPDLAIAEDGFQLLFDRKEQLWYALAAVENVGSTTSPEFEVHFYNDDPGLGGELIGAVKHTVGPLERGRALSVESERFALGEGVSEVIVLIDPQNRVPESDETNNHASRRCFVKDGRPVKFLHQRYGRKEAGRESRQIVSGTRGVTTPTRPEPEKAYISKRISEIFQKLDELDAEMKRRSREYLTPMSDEALARTYVNKHSPQPLAGALQEVRRDRQLVIERMVRHGYAWSEQDEDFFENNFDQLASELASLGPEALPELSQYISGPYAAERKSPLTMRALRKMGRDVVEPLIELADAQDDVLRANVIRVLSWLADGRAKDVLLQGLDDNPGFVRADALRGLLRLGPDIVGKQKLVGLLIDRLQDEACFRAAIWGLTRYGDESAIEQLRAVERSYQGRDQESVRSSIAEAVNAILRRAGPQIIYVDADAVGANNGASWLDAYRYLQDALAAAGGGCEIRVAQGVYKPDQSKARTRGSRTASFQLRNGVTVKGGYAGYGEQEPDARDVAVFRTLLSGDLKGNDADVADPEGLWAESTRLDNSYHVVTCVSEPPAYINYVTLGKKTIRISGEANSDRAVGDKGLRQQDDQSQKIEYVRPQRNDRVFPDTRTYRPAVLDGFIITGGHANDDSPRNSFANRHGGGMFIKEASPTITNCTFTGNSANGGGGMYSRSCSPKITNCTFRGNFASHWGGGIRNEAASPIMTSCTFSGNVAVEHAGGGISNVAASRPTITNSVFKANSARLGGGVHNGGSHPALTNCLFTANSSRYGGGMRNDHDSNPTLINCSFSYNSAKGGGGGMHNMGSNIVLIHCHIGANKTEGRGGGMLNGDSGGTVTNCTFTRNSANSGGGMHNARSSPSLMNCVFSGNRTTYAGGGGMRNDSNSSPTLRNCLFFGNYAPNLGGGICNYDSSPTLINCTLASNKGAHGGGVCNDGQSSPILTNCILWANTQSGGGTVLDAQIAYGSPVISYSCIQDASPDDTSVCPGAGNIDDEPLLVKPGYWAGIHDKNIAVAPDDPTAVWIDGDYHLFQGSPCIDAGNPYYAGAPHETDLGGRPRIAGGIVDMGCYESDATSISAAPGPIVPAPAHERLEKPVVAGDNDERVLAELEAIAAGPIAEQTARQVEADPVITTLKQQLELQESVLAGRLAKLGENHPAVRETQQTIEQIRENIRLRKMEIAEQIRRSNLGIAHEQLEAEKTRKEMAARERAKIAKKLAALDEHRIRLQRDLDAAEKSLEDVRVRWGISDLEERNYPHPITSRLGRLQEERDNCIVEASRLEASIDILDKKVKAADAEQKAQQFKVNLEKARDELILLRSKLEQLEQMVHEAEAEKKELDSARAQYKQRLAVRDERRQMLDSIKEQIEKLRIVHDDPQLTAAPLNVGELDKGEPEPQQRRLSREEIRAKLVNLERRRLNIQRELDEAERAMEEVRDRWGFADLEERSYPHPVTARLMRLEQERDACLVEIARLKAEINNLEQQGETADGKANLKKAQDNLVVLQQKYEQLQRMCDEAALKKKELDMARVQYKQRASVRDERKRMLDSIKEQIEKLRILYDDPATPEVHEQPGPREDEDRASKEDEEEKAYRRMMDKSERK